jgi:hypothetical protein
MRHIYAWQIIAIIILAVTFVVRRRMMSGAAKTGAGAVKKPPTPSPLPKVEHKPKETFAALRHQAIATDPQTLVLPDDFKPEDAFGVLMESTIADTVVTLASFATGDASLYFQKGGGMVGGGRHDNVRKAAKDLVAQVQAALPLMTPTTAYPLPGPDQIRFYALTPRGALTAEADRKSLSENPGPLSALYLAGQEVVAQMRQVGDQRGPVGGRPTNHSGET